MQDRTLLRIEAVSIIVEVVLTFAVALEPTPSDDSDNEPVLQVIADIPIWTGNL